MAYNRRNLLLKVLKIQEITMEHTNKGITQKWVFDNVIRPEFTISERTYKSYLAINAKKEIKQLDDEKPI